MTSTEDTGRPARSASWGRKNIRAPRCSRCHDSGAILFDQVEDGRKVVFAYQCVCEARGKHPNLVPPPRAPQERF